MKFLTDENIAKSVVNSLRKAGFNVKDIKEENLQGTNDKDILNLANNENRIIITHDKDFGNILYSQNVQHKGIILIRLKNQSPTNATKILLNLLNSGIKDKISDNLIIISENQIVVYKT